ncbi:MAG: DUF5658 family protein [Gemmataceae bacterium]|nr:DUF5658 family protein [Gemmataceae bacterium]
MRANTLHPGKLSLFAVLSGADLFLTWRLLEHGDGWLYESNPVAAWWLAHFGWLGLTAFKTAGVLLVVGLVMVISRSQPRTGGWVLGFACSVPALVVLYSTALAGLLDRHPDFLQREVLQGALEKNRLLEERLQQVQEYQALLRRLSEDLRAQRCTLPEAVEQLGCSANGRNPVWLSGLRRHYPGYSDEECLAANFVVHAVAALRDNPDAARRLGEAYVAAYGRTAPCSLPTTPSLLAAEDAESGGAAAGDPLMPPLPRRCSGAGPTRLRLASWPQ